MTMSTNAESTSQPRPEHPSISLLCDGVGLERDKAFLLLADAGWNRERFEEECAKPGWPERLHESVRAADVARAEVATQKRVTWMVQGGPGWAAQLTMGESLKKIRNEHLGRLAESYNPLDHGGRLIVGPTGLGKSVACLAVARRLMLNQEVRIREKNRADGGQRWEVETARRGSFVWVRAFDLANASLEHKLGNGEAEEIKKAREASFLVLDDIGWESRRASGDEAVLEVIGDRYDRGLMTIATSGWRVDALVERYGDAVIRRIVEAGGKPGKVLDLWPREAKS